MPDNYLAHDRLGALMSRRGDITGAVSHLSEAVRLAPALGEAHSSLGYALQQQGRTSDAIAQYEDAIQLNPADADARNNFRRRARCDGPY